MGNQRVISINPGAKPLGELHHPGALTSVILNRVSTTGKRPAHALRRHSSWLMGLLVFAGKMFDV